MTVDEALSILDKLLAPTPLNTIQELVFRATWAGKSYSEMVIEFSYEESYLKEVGAELWKVLTKKLGFRVSKSNIQSVLQRQQRGLTVAEIKHPLASPIPSTPKVDWGEAMDVVSFIGRETELRELEQWILIDRVRLVAIVGMGGMGKSALTVRLVERLLERTDFEFMVWRSLRNAPTLETLLIDLIQVLSGQQELQSRLPQNIPDLTQKLMDYLRRSRCLVVLDNVETILRPEYKDYSELLRQLGETRHQSCILITSREKPSSIAILEGHQSPVRSQLLRGLTPNHAQALFAQRATFAATATDWESLVHKYAGNPLALKIVASAVEELFDCKLEKFVEFLKNQTIIFDDIRDLLDHQFERLSDLEKEAMIWLAINREFIDLSELQTDLISPQSQRHLPENLKSLLRKSLIEVQGKQFTQQPVVMEYMTEKIIEQIAVELQNWNLLLDLGTFSQSYLHRYALFKVTSKDYVANSQIRVLLTPIVQSLRTAIILEQSLQDLLEVLRSLLIHTPTYSIGNLINLLRLLGMDLRGWDFSRLCVWQADLRGIPLQGVNFQDADLSKSGFSESLGGVFDAVFLPDGIHLVTGDALGTVSLWHHPTAQQLRVFDRMSSWINSLAVSPDGQYVAATAAATVRLWQIATGEALYTLTEHGGSWIHRVVFSADSRTLMTCGGEDRTIRLWDVATGQCQQVFEFPATDALSCDFSPDDRLIAVAHSDRTITLWERSTQRWLRTFSGHDNQVWSVVFSPDGQRLVSGGIDRLVKIWQVETGECLHTCSGHKDQIWGVTISPDGNTIASVSVDHSAKLWSVGTGQCLRTLEGFGAHVYGADFSPDGLLLVTSSMDQSLRIWEVKTGACRKLWRGYRNDSWEAKILPHENGYLLAAAWRDGVTRIWQWPSGESVRPLPVLQTWGWSIHEISSIAAQRLGIDRGVITGNDQVIRLWNLDTGTVIREFRGHQGNVVRFAEVPDQHQFVSCSMDATLRLWDLETGECLHVLTGHQHFVWDVDISPTAPLMASVSFDGTTKLWDLNTRECLRTIASHASQLCAVVFSLDGEQLITSGTNGAISIWDAQTGECLHTLSGHQGWVSALALSPDGTVLASGSIDNTVRLWDLQSMTCTHVLKKHKQWVLSVSFSPDGKLLVSSGCDEILCLWDRVSGEFVRTIAPERLYGGMNITNVVGLTEAQKLTLKELGAVDIRSTQCKT